MPVSPRCPPVLLLVQTFVLGCHAQGFNIGGFIQNGVNTGVGMTNAGIHATTDLVTTGQISDGTAHEMGDAAIAGFQVSMQGAQAGIMMSNGAMQALNTNQAGACADDPNFRSHEISSHRCADYSGSMQEYCAQARDADGIVAAAACPISCGTCDAGNTPQQQAHQEQCANPAADSNEGCSGWAASGQCDQNPDFMHSSCATACCRELRAIPDVSSDLYFNPLAHSTLSCFLSLASNPRLKFTHVLLDVCAGHGAGPPAPAPAPPPPQAPSPAPPMVPPTEPCPYDASRSDSMAVVMACHTCAALLPGDDEPNQALVLSSGW